MEHHYSVSPWEIREEGFHPELLRESESVFALANGFLGLRGNLEERSAAAAPTIEGSFINGVFDSQPIIYGEAAYGYAREHQTICNVMDAKSLILLADGERLELGRSRVSDHFRSLDLRAGLLRRGFVWQTQSGCCLRVMLERLVSLTRTELAACRLELSCLSGSCSLLLESPLEPALIAEGDPNDPRSAAGKDRRLLTASRQAEGSLIAMSQGTKNTGIIVSCAVEHRGQLSASSYLTESGALWRGEIALRAGDSVRLEKSICYTVSRHGQGEGLEQAREKCQAAPGFAELAREQRCCLDRFWARAGVDIDGDDALLQGLRFNLFHLFQSVGRDGRRSIAAKGLTGEGYEGHYFWDAEAYILPVFLHTEPELARRMLEYRYHTLPQARQRARVMGHQRGALYPWRTIDGEECSAYFPAGTAQYHIDGDVAHAVWDYYRVSGDLDFLAAYGAEMLVETARLYYDLGFFSPAKEGRFVVNCVTGPDEYNVLVDNNVYTNAVAEETFRHGAQALELLRRQRPEDYQRLCGELDLAPAEAEAWLRAAELMYYPAPRDGVYPQDDGFLEREPWPRSEIPADKRPLLLHFHGLNIYRRQVCKQADLILAMTLFGERYTLEEKRKNFFFYDRITTHDSSLSQAVFSILANEIGEEELAYSYFISSARLDLDNIQRNTKDGLHMANMAGTWIGLAKGFGGMRYAGERLAFAPVCPTAWRGYSFRVWFRGRALEIRVNGDGVCYRLLEGEPLTILSYGREVELK